MYAHWYIEYFAISIMCHLLLYKSCEGMNYEKKILNFINYFNLNHSIEIKAQSEHSESCFYINVLFPSFSLFLLGSKLFQHELL